MNENIDLRMANYLTILSNPEIARNIEPEVIRAMGRAVDIYAAKTSAEYIREFKKQEQVEEANKMFR